MSKGRDIALATASRPSYAHSTDAPTDVSIFAIASCSVRVVLGKEDTNAVENTIGSDWRNRSSRSLRTVRARMLRSSSAQRQPERAAVARNALTKAERPAEVARRAVGESANPSPVPPCVCETVRSACSERLEQVGVPVWCDADAGVGDVDSQQWSINRMNRRQRDSHVPACGELDRVGDQID